MCCALNVPKCLSATKNYLLLQVLVEGELPGVCLTLLKGIFWNSKLGTFFLVLSLDSSVSEASTLSSSSRIIPTLQLVIVLCPKLLFSLHLFFNSGIVRVVAGMWGLSPGCGLEVASPVAIGVSTTWATLKLPETEHMQAFNELVQTAIKMPGKCLEIKTFQARATDLVRLALEW